MTSKTQGNAQRIDQAIARIRKSGEPGLMTHIIYGYPRVEDNEDLIETMVEAGVDLIEVQLPFSDPTADGPTITQACQVALDNGAQIQDGIEFVARMTEKYDVPILFMSYFNIVYSYHAPGEEERGVQSFVKAAAKAGASGLIVPDIPPEEKSERYPELCKEAGLYPIYVTSPNVSESRLKAIAEVAEGFIYCTSRTGTTGKDVDLEMEMLGAFLKQTHDVCQLPVAVGFSIARRDQVEALAPHAEVAVVGSHLLRTFDERGASGLREEILKLKGK